MTDDAPRRVSLAVLPGTVNRLRMPLRTVACWRLGDGVFRFDHKLIGPEARPAFAEFWAIRDRHPSAPIALFGHADIKGDEDYNHRLAAERALAVYGVLNANPNLWYELFADDRAALANLHGVLRDYGLPHGEDGFGPGTFEAVARYLEHLGGGRRLESYDYLDDGRHAMQSCSELNPVLRPSRGLLDRLTASERAKLEAVNRRVVAYFFEPGTYVGDRWPCPVAGAGIEDCKARLWSDAAQRRATPKKALQYWPPWFRGRPGKPFVGSRSTFACRFYERIAEGRGCERVDPWPPPEPVPPPEEDDDIIIVDDDDPPPPPPPPPPEWVLHLKCGHEDHTNRRWIYTSGRDVLQVVPSSFGDLVTMETEPAERVDWSLPDGTSTTGMAATWTVPEVVAVNPKPWDLLDWKPTKYLVVATKGTREQACVIEAYPRAQYSYDFERIRKRIRKMFEPAVAAWNAIGEYFAEEFKLELLEEGDFGGHLKMQWREHPGPGGGTLDYRTYLGYWFVLYAEPLARCAATMSIPLTKILNFLKRYKAGKRFVDGLPAWLTERLDSIELKGGVVIEGGGRQKLIVDEPGSRIPAIGTDAPGAPKAEFHGVFEWVGLGGGDLDKLITGKEGTDVGSITVSVGMSLTATLGIILDVEAKRFGAYVDASFKGLDLSVTVGLPLGLGEETFGFQGLLAKELDRVEATFDL